MTDRPPSHLEPRDTFNLDPGGIAFMRNLQRNPDWYIRAMVKVYDECSNGVAGQTPKDRKKAAYLRDQAQAELLRRKLLGLEVPMILDMDSEERGH